MNIAGFHQRYTASRNLVTARVTGDSIAFEYELPYPIQPVVTLARKPEGSTYELGGVFDSPGLYRFETNVGPMTVVVYDRAVLEWPQISYDCPVPGPHESVRDPRMKSHEARRNILLSITRHSSDEAAIACLETPDALKAPYGLTGPLVLSDSGINFKLFGCY